MNLNLGIEMSNLERKNNSVSVNALAVNNTHYKSKVGRPLKKIIITNNHINVIRKIVNEAEENYLNLTQRVFDKYQTHLTSGGTLSITIEKYKSANDKKLGKDPIKKFISVKEIKLLGFRDTKNGIYRCKLVSYHSDIVEKTPKNHVLISRMGGKTKFRDKYDYVLDQTGLKNKNIPVVLDAFFGGGGITFHAIDKLKFDRYIINDLEPLIYKTYLAVKKDYKKVIEIYEAHNNKYLSLFTDELKSIKKDPNCKTRLDPKLQAARNKDRRYKEYYQSIGKKLDNHKTMSIYEVAACFIFFNSRSNCGVLAFNKDNTIDLTNCDNSHTPKDKTPMIKQWAFLLNYHNVELLNKDVFDVLQEIPKSSLVFSDSPYIAVEEEDDDKIMNYDFENDGKFQCKLKEELDTFENVIYSNEHCKRLYDLGLSKGFDGYCVFPRNNKLGQKKEKKREAVDFLAYRSTVIKRAVHLHIHTQLVENQLAA